MIYSSRRNEANIYFETFQNNNRMKFHKLKSKLIKNKNEAKIVYLNGDEIKEAEQCK